MPRLLSILVSLLLAACSRPAPKVTPVSQIYPVRGTVVSVAPEQKHLRLAHEDIPGFMEAMTMEFDVATSAEIAALLPGDIITGKLEVTETHTTLLAIQKVGHTAPPNPPVQAGAPAPGSLLPDATLLDDTGKLLRISDLRGKTLALTFIYTRCPLPDFCPRMNSHFATAARDLAGDNFRLLSLTIDPANDTPQILADYAKQFQPRPAQWRFLTGELPEVTRLATFAGLQIRKADAQLDHNLRTLIIAPDGTVAKTLSGNQWQPAELVAEMKRLAR